METPEELRQRVHREKQLAAGLRLATTRFEEAQRERIWAVAAARQAGLSIRRIAAATGLSSSRVHQLLSSKEAREIPLWLSQLRQQGRSSEENAASDQPSPSSDLQARLAQELEVLRWCLDWLVRLERGEG